jgi:DNA-binding response OmpR family regulator
VRVLIVEDEAALADAIARGLRRRGWAVDLAHDGDEGLGKALVNDYDVVVLDRDLPVLHGDDVCRQLNDAARPCRILMLTAAASLDELVAGLGLGADDYLTKPFRFEELVARIAALARRAAAPTPVVLRVDDLVVDPARAEVCRGGRPLHLTARELAVLELLVRADGRAVSAEELFEKAWDDQADPMSTSVRVIVSRLRSKLGDPPLIHTVVGRGYRIAAP